MTSFVVFRRHMWNISTDLGLKTRARKLDGPSLLKQGREFPGGAVVKNPPADAGDMGSILGPGRSHMLRNN